MANKINPKKNVSLKTKTGLVQPNKAEQPFSGVNNLLTKLDSFKNFRSSKTFYIILIIIGILILAMYKKNWFVAAMINGSPLTNLELQINTFQKEAPPRPKNA